MGCMTCGQEHAAIETCAECGFEPFVRNHFFTGKMMGAAEFATETLYHSDKMRHHNARLHGAGVVCGLKASQHPSAECRPRYVVVSPGSALDCCGREILVAQDEIVDVVNHPHVAGLRKEAVPHLHTLQLCIAYRDCPTEDVPVLYDECGCDDTKCAPNRILESFRFDVLVDPPLAAADLAGRAPLGAFVATDRHGLTGFSRASAAGKVLAADPGRSTDPAGPDATTPKRLFILDTRYRSMKTITLAPTETARAAALSADGNFVFAFVQSRVRIFKVEDASEVTPAGLNFDLPASVSGAVSAAAGTGQNGLLVYDAVNGKVYRWKADAAAGLVDAAPNVITLGSGANLTGVVANADGSAVFGIASGKVNQYTLSSPATAKQYTPTTTPGALAAFTLGTKPMLAVASRTDKRVYLLDLSVATPTATPIDLDRPPAFVGAATDPAPATANDVWLHVLGEEGGHLYEQAVSLKPLTDTTPGTPLLTAPRLAADGARAIVLAFPAGQAGVVHPTALADSDCADHLSKQLEGCPACELPDCVVLATVSNYQPGKVLDNASIDNTLGRRVVASTATLQAWLQCLHLKGGIPGPGGPQGPQGPDGLGINGVDAQIVPCTQPPVASFDTTTRVITLRVPRGCDGKDAIGLYPNLPKVLDIGWRFEEAINASQFIMQHFLLHQQLTTMNLEGRVRELVKGGKPPPLTIYFNKQVKGVTRRTFGATIADIPWQGKDKQGNLGPNGLYVPIDLKLYPTLIETVGPVPTPHTGEQAAYAVTMVMPEAFFLSVDSNGNQTIGLPFLLFLVLMNFVSKAKGDLPRVLVDLRGDFVYAPNVVTGAYDEFGVVDANNIGGRVGDPVAARQPPILGGKNPSGNLTQGGLFESWFFLTAGDAHVPGTDSMAATASALVAGSPLGAAFGARAPSVAVRVPPTANFGSEDELAALPGVSRALAKRIVKARETKPIEGLADLRRRANLTDAEWAKLKDHLIVL